MTRKFRAASRRRAKAIGLALATCIALVTALAACGHYGPPARAEHDARDDATLLAPLPEPDAPDTPTDSEQRPDE